MIEPAKRRETLVAGPRERGERLDVFIARSLDGASRKQVKRALDGGQVFVDGQVMRRAGFPLKGGETISLTLGIPPPKTSRPMMKFIFRDEFLLAVDKPPNLPSHPTVAGSANALDLVNESLRAEGRVEPPILLHRLDAETSGLLLFALTVEANREVSGQFARREVQKTYLGLVAGSPPGSFGVVNHLKAGVRGRTVAVRSGGQAAETEFRTLGKGEGFSLVEARPLSGRTHQIRAHLAGKGFPLLGDPLYGGPVSIALGEERAHIRRHLLHAFRLVLRHPATGVPINLEAPLPEDFLAFTKLLKKPSEKVPRF